MRKKNFPRAKAFSLVELLVSMAIIAVLLGLVGFGIATAQRNSRDSQRRSTVSDMKLGLEDYLIRKNKYPTRDNMAYNNGVIEFTDGNEVIVSIQVDGPASPSSSNSTTSSNTWFCFENDGAGGYLLGAKLENSDWHDASSTIQGTTELTDTYCGDKNPF